MRDRIWRGPEISSGDPATLVALALASAQRNPAGPALIDAASGAVISYGELADRFLRLASALCDAGLKHGDVLAILSPNSSAWVTMALGAMAAGGTVSGINPALKPEEIRRQIGAANASYLAVTSALVPLVERSGLAKLVKEVILLDDAGAGHRSLADLIRTGRPAPRAPSPDDVALLPFSSGTSGFPKGVVIPGRSLGLAARAARSALGVTEQDVLLASSPLFHIVSISGMLSPALALGSPVVIMAAPDFEAMLAAIERYRVTLSAITPPVVRAMRDHPAVGHYNLSSLRGLVCTAAPLAAEVQTEATRRIGKTISQAYGMTESVGAVTLGPLADPRPGSCGRPAAGFEIRIVEAETGSEAERLGEIWIRSPMRMREYYKDAQATAETITQDGWLRTGDLGYFDTDGNLFLVDRLKELIKVDSSQVAPAELEAIIAAYPGAADVAVVGRPCATSGECPVAYVVARTPIDADALMAWVAERVAPFKRLHAVEFVDAIPRQPNGKIMRRLLKERERAAA